MPDIRWKPETIVGPSPNNLTYGFPCRRVKDYTVLTRKLDPEISFIFCLSYGNYGSANSDNVIF